MAGGLIPVPEGEIFVQDQGSGEPLVLLHAGGLDHRMWDDQVDAFTQAGYRVIRYDYRGHGWSSTPRTDFVAREDLRIVLDHVGVSRACLVGACLGARTAVDFILAYPDAVEMAVLASPAVSGMRFTDPTLLRLLRQQAMAARTGDAHTYVDSFLRAWVDGPHRQPDDVALAMRQRCEAMSAELFQRHRGTIVRAGDTNAVDRLRELTVPLLVLVGDLDTPDIHTIAGRIEAEAPLVASAVVPGTGHALTMEQPEAFTAAVLTYFARARELSGHVTVPAR